MGFTLSNFLSVDICPVKTAKISNANLRGIDIKQTMVTGDGAMGFVVGKFGVALISTSHDAGIAIAEIEGLSF